MTLLRYCKVLTPSGQEWKRLPVAQACNGRIKQGYALVNGQPQLCPIGYYILRYYEDRKVKYENVGINAASARSAAEQKASWLKLKCDAGGHGIELEEQPTRKVLRKEAARYVQDCRDRGASEASIQAKNVTDEFLTACRKVYLDEVARSDIFTFHSSCRERGLSARTVANKHDRLKWFLKWAGADVEQIMPPRPRYETKMGVYYGQQQIERLMAATEGSFIGVAVRIGYACGLREMEIAHLEWCDINWHARTLSVRGKEQYGFHVKDYEQRELPIPLVLATLLASWRDNHPDTTLVLGTKSDKPEYHLLRTLKRAARRAGLNCGTCKGCTSEAKECRTWTLHALRRTFATSLLRKRFDLRTIQRLMGHAALATTAKYLAALDNTEIQAEIDLAFILE